VPGSILEQSRARIETSRVKTLSLELIFEKEGNLGRSALPHHGQSAKLDPTLDLISSTSAIGQNDCMNNPALTIQNLNTHACQSAASVLRKCVLVYAGLIAVTVSDAHADCADIRLLGSLMDSTELQLMDMGALVDPGPNQRRIVEEAKGFFSPLHCHAVTRIAYVNTDGDNVEKWAWVGGSIRDLINLSAISSKLSENNLSQPSHAAGYRANAVKTIVHEATHAADNLLDFVAPQRPVGVGERLIAKNAWSRANLQFAREIVQTNLLDRGLRHEWEKLHMAAVRLGYAQNYHHKGDLHMSADAIIKMGVASGYGGDEPAEDIAEMASGILTGRVWAKYGATVPNPPDDLICDRMRAEPGPGIPQELALIYAKVGLLNSVGLIGDLEYDYCVGKLKVSAPGNGFFTIRDNRQENAYTGDVKGTIGKRSKDGVWVFQLEASGSVGVAGEPRPARIELLIPLAAAGEPRPSFPRGLFNVGQGGTTVNIYYTHEGEEKLGVSVESGVLLMSRASTQLIEGSIVVFRFVNWTSLLALPEVAGNTRITFKKKN